LPNKKLVAMLAGLALPIATTRQERRHQHRVLLDSSHRLMALYALNAHLRQPQFLQTAVGLAYRHRTIHRQFLNLATVKMEEALQELTRTVTSARKVRGTKTAPLVLLSLHKVDQRQMASLELNHRQECRDL
jgi:hypothetical protein